VHTSTEGVTEADTKSAQDGLRIGAGVLHYRNWPDVRPTIDALLAQSRLPDEILIIDHGSGDGSAAKIREAYPQVEVVELPDNQGPSAGDNRLMAAVLAKDVDAVMYLTDDIVLAPDALERLAARLDEDPALGIVAPLVAYLHKPERVFSGGGYVDARTWDFEFRDTPPRVADWEGLPPRRVDFMVTPGTLMRASARRSVGPIAEHFYYGLEDIDFTLRLGALGWGLECVPSAVAWQDVGDTSGETSLSPHMTYLKVRNRLGVIARNAPRRMLARELVRMLWWLVRDAIRPQSGSRADLRPRLRGLIDFCRGRWGPPPAAR
jgi:GT2 family glycosyltransferase